MKNKIVHFDKKPRYSFIMAAAICCITVEIQCDTTLQAQSKCRDCTMPDSSHHHRFLYFQSTSPFLPPSVLL